MLITGHRSRFLLVTVLAVVVLAPQRGQPATIAAANLAFTTNSTADTPGANPGDGICADATGQFPNKYCLLTVNFYPQALSPISGSLAIYDNVTGIPQLVPLSKTGMPNLILSPTPTDTPTATPTNPSTSMPTNTAATATPVPQLIVITSSGANPALVTILSGSPVVFTNDDDIAHTVTANDGSFGPLLLGSGGSATIVLTATNTYTDTYTIDKVTNPTGSIVVLGTGGSPTSTATPTTTPTATSTNTPTPLPTSTPTSTRVPAALVVYPTSGVYQQSTTLTGTNFAANEVVNIYADRTDKAPLYIATTGANGIFVLPATVHQGTFGLHTLIAVGQNSALTATAPFTELASLVLTPISGAVGARVLVSGYGFAASERVTTYWQSQRGLILGTATANTHGTFAGSAALVFSVPMSPAGSYPVISVGQSSGAIASRPFILVPSLRITPNRGKAGSNATVSGTGYGAHEAVTVRWDCASTRCTSTTILGSQVTDGRGTFNGLHVTIPATASRGRHAVGGKGGTTNAFADTFYTVTL